MAATSTSCQKIRDFFQALDVNDVGAINRASMRDLLSDIKISESEFDKLFREMDKDNDGKISEKDFVQGFPALVNIYNSNGIVKDIIPESGSEAWLKFMINHEEYLDCADQSSQEKICSFYQKLHKSDKTQTAMLVNGFEDLIFGILHDLKEVQSQNLQLEDLLKRDKEDHDRQIVQLEEELESQLHKVQKTTQVEERDRAQQEKFALKTELESEIREMRANLAHLQEMEDEFKSKHYDDSTVVEMKRKFENIMSENRHLQSSLSDIQTSLALARSDIAQYKENYEESVKELKAEKAAITDYITENDNLSHQLQLLREANKRLHDSNDDLRAALEKSQSKIDRLVRSNAAGGGSMRLAQRERRGSTISNYLNHAYPNTQSFMEEEEREWSDGACSLSSLSRKDSGRSTLHADLDTEREEMSEVDGPVSAAASRNASFREARRWRQLNILRQHSRLASDSMSEMDGGLTTEVPESQDETDVEYGSSSNYKNSRRLHTTPHNHNPSSSSSLSWTGGPHSAHRRSNASSAAAATSSSSAFNRFAQNSIDGRSTPTNQSATPPGFNQQPQQMPPMNPSRASLRRSKPTSSSKRPNIPVKPLGDPERLYKIVLCGDTAVGKSSFIVRLCQGKFVGNLATTLGVDFQTKTLEVDNHVIALQLWDTAGQERFRSIAKSYFRRADGVLLLYDVSYERSFLSVRQWIESIQDATGKKICVMICGNKADLRESASDEGKRCVTPEEGSRLAREYNALFIETSVKDGQNVQEAVTELSRLLRANEDLEVKTAGMKLHEIPEKDKDSSSCTPSCMN